MWVFLSFVPLLLAASWESCYPSHVQHPGLLLTAGTTDASTTCASRCIELSSKCLINRINYPLFQPFYLANEVIKLLNYFFII